MVIRSKLRKTASLKGQEIDDTSDYDGGGEEVRCEKRLVGKYGGR